MLISSLFSHILNLYSRLKKSLVNRMKLRRSSLKQEMEYKWLRIECLKAIFRIPFSLNFFENYLILIFCCSSQTSKVAAISKDALNCIYIIPTVFTATHSTELYFGLTTTVVSEQQSNIIPEFWRHKISERSGPCFNDAAGSPWRFTCVWCCLGWFTCIWLYPQMICLDMTLLLDDMLAFDFTLGWFTCIWHYPWMVYLHLTVPSDDLYAYDFILGRVACIWLYPWMVYLQLTLPLDDLLAFDFNLGWFTCIWRYPWMIHLHFTSLLDDLLAFGFTLGWYTCIWHYPWMIYLHLTLPLDDLLAFDISLGSNTDCKADLFRIETWWT